MVERPNWNYDNSGGEIAPAMPSPQEVVAAVERGEPPTREQQLAFGVEPTAPATSTAPVPAERGIDGIMRQDWDKPRNESGQFITKSDAELRQQWEKEGGFEQNRDRVLAVESKILSLSENPQALQSHIATLPEAIQLKAADVMRLPTGYGPDGGAIKFEIFLDSLSPSELQTFEGWWRGLSRGNQDCILAAISRP